MTTEFKRGMLAAADILDRMSETCTESSDQLSRVSVQAYGHAASVIRSTAQGLPEAEELCPFPIACDDGTAKQCRDNGHCGCSLAPESENKK